MSEAEARYEKRDADARGIMWCAIVIVVTVTIVNVSMWFFELWLYRTDARGTAASRIAAPRIEPPLPRLQSNPAADLKELHAAEDAVLNSYGWVDRQSGVVRIPIEKAMDLTSKRGLPTRKQNEKPEP